MMMLLLLLALFLPVIDASSWVRLQPFQVEYKVVEEKEEAQTLTIADLRTHTQSYLSHQLQEAGVLLNDIHLVHSILSSSNNKTDELNNSDNVTVAYSIELTFGMTTKDFVGVVSLIREKVHESLDDEEYIQFLNRLGWPSLEQVVLRNADGSLMQARPRVIQEEPPVNLMWIWMILVLPGLVTLYLLLSWSYYVCCSRKKSMGDGLEKRDESSTSGSDAASLQDAVSLGLESFGSRSYWA